MEWTKRKRKTGEIHRNFFSVTKATELNMYFQALSRVESECAQHEQRFRALRASRELSEFFKRIELSELEAKKSVEKSMERLRAMEFQIKSSVHETLLETQNVHNQTRERLNLTLTRVQEAQNAVEKLTAFAKVHAMRLKELAITFNRMRDALSKSSLVFFFFVWWFVFGTSFVPHALRTFLRESLRQILGAVLCSHAIEIALVPRFVSIITVGSIKSRKRRKSEEDIDIELLIAQATQLVRATVAATVAVRSIRTTMLKNKREKSRLLEQEAFARCLRRVETDVRALLAERRGREEEEEEEKRGRRGRVVVKASLPPSRRREDENDSDDDEEISEKTKKTKKKVNTFNEDFVETIDEDEKIDEDEEKSKRGKSEGRPERTPHGGLKKDERRGGDENIAPDGVPVEIAQRHRREARAFDRNWIWSGTDVA